MSSPASRSRRRILVVLKRHFTVFGVGVAAVFEERERIASNTRPAGGVNLPRAALLGAACDVPGTGPLLLGGFAF